MLTGIMSMKKLLGLDNIMWAKIKPIALNRIMVDKGIGLRDLEENPLW